MTKKVKYTHDVIPEQTGTQVSYNLNTRSRVIARDDEVGIIQKIIFILLLFILTACASKGPGDKYLTQISTTRQKEYNIPNGELVAKYNLVGTSGQNQCIFAKDYGLIVGDGGASQKFLSSAGRRLENTGMLQSQSKGKASDLYNRVLTLNTNYNVISKSDLRKLQALVSIPTAKEASSPFDFLDKKPQTISANYFANLASIDRKLRNIPLFLPQTNTILTSPFGNRKIALYGETKFHKGTDFASHKHALVHAAADGKIIEVAHSKSYGNFMLIDHGGLFKTRYAHLSRLYADSGDRVFQGQSIGLQGSSGRSTGDHLHFEVIYQGKAIDPMIFVGEEYRCRRS